MFVGFFFDDFLGSINYQLRQLSKHIKTSKNNHHFAHIFPHPLLPNISKALTQVVTKRQALETYQAALALRASDAELHAELHAEFREAQGLLPKHQRRHLGREGSSGRVGGDDGFFVGCRKCKKVILQHNSHFFWGGGSCFLRLFFALRGWVF